MQKSIEEWERDGVTLKPIPDILGYAAGDDGHIYSFRKAGGRGKRYTPRPRRLREGETDRGYRTVGLYWRNHLVRRVSRLVCAAFHGRCPEGMECSHLNGDKSNNRPDNLTWETPRRNTRRQRVHGTSARGERHGSSVLCEEDVLAIMERVGNETNRSIAEDYGVSDSTIGRIARGVLWSHVAAALRERKGGE